MDVLRNSGRLRLRACLAGLALAAGSWMTSGLVAASPASREYDLKAVFLYNLASFVEWPSTSFTSPEAPFVVGVLGRDPFGRVLDDIFANEYIGKHPFVVRRFRRGDDATGCHLLFVAESEIRWLPEVLRSVQGHPVLTVSDVPSFVQAGGMIGFGRRGDHLELFVNHPAVRAAELVVSSKLLELAQVAEFAALP